MKHICYICETEWVGGIDCPECGTTDTMGYEKVMVKLNKTKMKKKMIRTQIYITEEISDALTFMAKIKKKTKAVLIRKFIVNGIIMEKKKKRTPNLSSLAKLNIREGPKDLSKNLDKYLYGGK